jgi:signal transduction histidine kinase
MGPGLVLTWLTYAHLKLNTCMEDLDYRHPRGLHRATETALCQLDELAVGSLGMETGGRYCRLSVHDTGEGMSAEMQQHLFEPFYTTTEI